MSDEIVLVLAPPRGHMGKWEVGDLLDLPRTGGHFRVVEADEPDWDADTQRIVVVSS